MRLWKIIGRWILGGFAVLTAAVAIGGFFLPSTMVVVQEREIPVAAPELYDRVAALKRWPEWAPWWQKDPFLETEFSGPETGTGAVMKWMSKHEGEGRGKIVAVIPNKQINLALDFAEKGEGTCTFDFEESADRKKTKVRWQFRMGFGDNTGRRYFGLFFRNSIRCDLADGLARLENAVLSAVKP